MRPTGGRKIAFETVKPQWKMVIREMAKRRFQAVSIYRRKRDGTVIVQTMARHPIGASASFGDPTEIGPPDFDRCIVGTVLDALEKYHKLSGVNYFSRLTTIIIPVSSDVP